MQTLLLGTAVYELATGNLSAGRYVGSDGPRNADELVAQQYREVQNEVVHPSHTHSGEHAIHVALAGLPSAEDGGLIVEPPSEPSSGGIVGGGTHNPIGSTGGHTNDGGGASGGKGSWWQQYRDKGGGRGVHGGGGRGRGGGGGGGNGGIHTTHGGGGGGGRGGPVNSGGKGRGGGIHRGRGGPMNLGGKGRGSGVHRGDDENNTPRDLRYAAQALIRTMRSRYATAPSGGYTPVLQMDPTWAYEEGLTIAEEAARDYTARYNEYLFETKGDIETARNLAGVGPEEAYRDLRQLASYANVAESEVPTFTRPNTWTQEYWLEVDSILQEELRFEGMAKAVRQGRSFTSAMSEFTPNDVIEGGGFGPRVYSGSKWVTYFEAAGGILTDTERGQVEMVDLFRHAQPDNFAPDTNRGLSTYELDELNRLDNTALTSRIASRQSLLMEQSELMNSEFVDIDLHVASTNSLGYATDASRAESRAFRAFRAAYLHDTDGAILGAAGRVGTAVEGLGTRTVGSTAVRVVKGVGRGVTKAAGPISAALVPVMAGIDAANNNAEMQTEIDNNTEAVANGTMTPEEKARRDSMAEDHRNHENAHDVGEETGAGIGGAVGFAAGAVAGSIVPGVGTIIGGVIGAIAGSFGGGAIGGAAGDTAGNAIFGQTTGQSHAMIDNRSMHTEDIQAFEAAHPGMILVNGVPVHRIPPAPAAPPPPPPEPQGGGCAVM